MSYGLDHQYHDHTPPDGRDGVSLSRECSTSIPLRLSVTPCASAAQRRRALIDNDKSLACLMIVPPCGQGDGYITAWYQVSIKTLKQPASRPLQRAQKLRCALGAGPLRASEGRAGAHMDASSRSCASGMRVFLRSDGDLIPSSGYDVNRLLS